jgi:SAM-dependent methyltransferase
MPIDDPVEVREQYAREDNLRARQALWENAIGTDPKQVLWRTIEEWQPKRLLEVGGGQGELAERIQSELGAEVTFLDLSPRMVELARARGVDARLGDAQELPFADGAFDTVVAAWMLYHVPDVDRALADFARVLVPGGALIAVTNSSDHIAELRALVQHGDSWAHTFTRENGERFLEPHFTSIESRDILVAYRDSVAVPTTEVPDDVALPFVVHGRSSIFFATT